MSFSMAGGSSTSMRFLYSLLYLMGLLALLPREYLKRPRDLRARWLRQKLGHIGKISSCTGPLVWVHAVSVGEAAVAVDMVKAMHARRPDLRFVVSTITDTGQKVARERLGGLAQVVYLPFDLAGPLKRALGVVRPSVFIVMETEIWPGLFMTLGEMGIPLVAMNGRISERSFRGYMRLGPLLKGPLGAVRLFCMQDETYAERIVAMGALSNDVVISGNFKFDLKVDPREIAWLSLLRGQVLVAGSTHPGEEGMILTAYRGLLGRHPELCLVLVPRHPHRAREVGAIAQGMGLAYRLRSALEGRTEPLGREVIVVDTVGELSAIYGAATVVVMGGSFIPHGGQNPLEAAYWGKPVLCGPHMENFPFVGEFYGADAALEASEHDMLEKIDALLGDEGLRAAIGGRARGIINRHRGAIDRALDALFSRVVI